MKDSSTQIHRCRLTLLKTQMNTAQTFCHDVQNTMTKLPLHDIDKFNISRLD